MEQVVEQVEQVAVEQVEQQEQQEHLVSSKLPNTFHNLCQ
jgi:hypothetical protein